MIREQAGQSVSCQMTALDGSEFTGVVTVYVLGDAGTLTLGSVGGGICTHEGAGLHSYLPSAAETNFDVAAFQFRGTGAITRTKEYPTLTQGQIAELSTSALAPGPTFVDLYDDALHVELGSNDTAVLFTSARRKHAINEGYRQFAQLTECYVRQSTIASTQGSQEFNLNSTSVIEDADYIRPASQGPVFQISDSNGVSQTLSGDAFPQVSLPFLDYAQSGWRSTETAYPSGWYLRSDGGQQIFGLDHPLGLSTGSTQTAAIIFPYVAKPSSMVNDADVPWTANGEARTDLSEYSQAFVHFGAHRLELLRKDKQASQQQLKEFLGYVQRYQDAKRPKGNRLVRTAVNYFRRARRHAD